MPFRRFHNDARQTVLRARDSARRLGADHIGTEHLLLALLEGDNTVARQVLERHGLTYDRAYTVVQRVSASSPDSQLDAQALEAIGIDIEAVRDKLEAVFGKGVLDAPQPTRRGRGRQMFGADARKTLELSLREAIHLHHNHISSGHLLLGLLRADDAAVHVLREAGIDPKAVREEVTAAL
jgi:ATP-dependent Clp protease ATP-binding subunit ClpA